MWFDAAKARDFIEAAAGPQTGSGKTAKTALGSAISANPANPANRVQAKSGGQCRSRHLLRPGSRTDVKTLDQGHEVQPNLAVSSPPSPQKFSLTGWPLTWTGRPVSPETWQSMTEWERFGPNGRNWNGITRRWEDN